MHGVGAADVGDAGFGQTKVAYLALPYEVTERAGHVLDRYVAVDEVLVEQIDVVGMQTRQRAFEGTADVFGSAAVTAELGVASLDVETDVGGGDRGVDGQDERGGVKKC